MALQDILFCPCCEHSFGWARANEAPPYCPWCSESYTPRVEAIPAYQVEHPENGATKGGFCIGNTGL